MKPVIYAKLYILISYGCCLITFINYYLSNIIASFPKDASSFKLRSSALLASVFFGQILNCKLKNCKLKNS